MSRERKFTGSRGIGNACLRGMQMEQCRVGWKVTKTLINETRKRLRVTYLIIMFLDNKYKKWSFESSVLCNMELSHLHK
jgi:hypothetical protein